MPRADETNNFLNSSVHFAGNSFRWFHLHQRQNTSLPDLSRHWMRPLEWIAVSFHIFGMIELSECSPLPPCWFWSKHITFLKGTQHYSRKTRHVESQVCFFQKQGILMISRGIFAWNKGSQGNDGFYSRNVAVLTFWSILNITGILPL